MIGLTATQNAALAAIRRYHARWGRFPSYQRIADEIGLSCNSKGRAYRLVGALIERGAIHRDRATRECRLVHEPIPTDPLSHGWRFIPARELDNPRYAA